MINPTFFLIMKSLAAMDDYSIDNAHHPSPTEVTRFELDIGRSSAGWA
jgi:hypothetical protein